MAIADFDAWKAALTSGAEQIPIQVSTTTTLAGRQYDLWRTLVPLGAVPTTAAAPDNTLLGAMGQQNGGSGTLTLMGALFQAQNPGSFIIADRLSHQGGLSGVTTGAQTTNLPTAALTRHTSGEGVMIGLTIYTQIGTTAVGVTVTYTNQSGTGSRVSPSTVIGGTAFREANRMIQIPLQEGDTGVRSVESVTISATTGTAGAFGVTLFKPLYVLVASTGNSIFGVDLLSSGTFGGFPEIIDGACLFPIAISASTNAQAAGSILTTEH